MKNSISQQQIIQEFDQLDGKITLISFGKDGKRALTHSGLNIHDAFMNIVQKIQRGQAIRIIREDAPFDLEMMGTLEEFDNDPRSKEFTFKFDFGFGRKK